jgi:arylsulfatase
MMLKRPFSLFTRRDVLRASLSVSAGAFLGLRGLATAAQPTAREAPASRPNVIVILVDDMGFSDLGCFGSEIKTPNLDRLATNGVRFTYMQNTARCCPSRASLLTGLYPTQTGIGTFIASKTDRSEFGPGYGGYFNRPFVTLPTVLREGGYRTGLSGKWHLGPDAVKSSGFEVMDHLFVGGAGTYFPDRRLGEQTATWTYRTDEIGDQAVAFAKESLAQGRPFLLYWAPTAPHWPYDVLEADLAVHKGIYEQGPKAVWQARVRRQREMGILKPNWPTPEPEGLYEATPGKNAKIRTEKRREGFTPATYSGWMEAYAGMVTSMDRNVGKMIAALESARQLDNTMILFLSDNGACAEPQSYGRAWATVSNAPFRRWKMDTYSGGVTTCAIAHWPAGIKLKPGTINHDPWHIVDIMPTVLDVTGCQRPNQDRKGRAIPAAEGVSLLPLLQGRPMPRRAPIGLEHKGNWGLIAGEWKIVAEALAKGDGHRVELYNIARDRAESRDLSKSEPAKLKELRKEWEAWAARVEANDKRK